MSLPDNLVKDFADLTNDTKNGTNETSIYGTIMALTSSDGDTTSYVQLDGSDVLTPIARTVDVNDGDRVLVNIKNHTAIVTGNTTDPAFGTKRAGNQYSTIMQEVERIETEVGDLESNLSSKITQNSNSIATLVTNQNEFSEFQQTVEGFSFMGKGGTVKISSGNLDLTGAITFSDLTSETQDTITAIETTADDALTKAINAQTKADQAYDIADSFYWPSYIKSTKITKTTIQSPTIEGNEVIARTAFQVTPVGTDESGDEVELPCGHMGVAFGQAYDENLEVYNTYGVAMASANTTTDNGYITYESEGFYIIVTNEGVRMQGGTHSLHVNANGAYYDNVEIGTGEGGEVVAVWG